MTAPTVGAAEQLAVMRRTVVDHIAHGMRSASPAQIVAAMSLQAELAFAGLPVDDDVDARLAAIEAAARRPGGGR